jgi:chromate transporter
LLKRRVSVTLCGHFKPLADSPIKLVISRKALQSLASTAEVFLIFLRFGLTSFGGPIAHLGYFYREFVLRRRWLDDAQYASLLATAQFLPGPSSSQLGFSVGLLRAGWPGALAAFCAFTLPSALLLFAFSIFSSTFDSRYAHAAMHGLKLMAVIVVAQSVLTTSRNFASDWPRAALAFVCGISAILMTHVPGAQLAVILLGAVAGPLICRSELAAVSAVLPIRHGVKTAAAMLGLFAILLAGSGLTPSGSPLLLRLAGAFYRVGALVFGGGHVVLPMLRNNVVDNGWLSDADFLAGYGAAQIVPGPMFSVAAFFGARILPDHAIVSALVSVIAIFLPGLLLISGVLPLWNRLATHAAISRSIAGVNVAVIGLLAAALYDPLWTNAVHGFIDLVIVMAGFILLALLRAPMLAVAGGCLSACLLVSLAGGSSPS